MHFWTVLIGWIEKKKKKNIRKEQMAQLIDGRNANEVTTKPWNKNGFHWSLHNTIGIDNFWLDKVDSPDMVQNDNNNNELGGPLKGDCGGFC